MTLIKLDSSLISGLTTAGSFRVDYPNGIGLDPKTNYEMALLSCTFWVADPNISPLLNNDVFRYSPDAGVTWKDITIPKGLWSIDQLENEIKRNVALLGDDETKFIMLSNSSTLKVDLTMTDGFQVDFQTSDLHKIIGWTSAIHTASGSGANLADVTSGLNTVNLLCSAVTGAFDNADQSDLLYSFSIIASPGQQQIISPLNLIYLPLSTKNLSHIQVELKDQSLTRVLDLDPVGAPVSYLLHIRKVKE